MPDDFSDLGTSSTTSRRGFLAGTAGTGLGLAVVGTIGLPLAAAGAAPGDPAWPDGPGSRNHPQRPDPELVAILAAIDPVRIEANVRKLVSPGTRHTLSVQDVPERGIGAARDWLYDEFKKAALPSGVA